MKNMKKLSKKASVLLCLLISAVIVSAGTILYLLEASVNVTTQQYKISFKWSDDLTYTPIPATLEDKDINLDAGEYTWVGIDINNEDDETFTIDLTGVLTVNSPDDFDLVELRDGNSPGGPITSIEVDPGIHTIYLYMQMEDWVTTGEYSVDVNIIPADVTITPA